MPPDHTMGDILTKIREIVSEEPMGGLPHRPASGPDTLQAGEESSTQDVVVPMPRVAAPTPARQDYSLFSAGMLEAVFTSAVQEAMAPAAQQWVNGHQTELVNALKPMIRTWMDERLPNVVESILRQELGRAIGKHLRP